VGQGGSQLSQPRARTGRWTSSAAS
jgi:hypothetical protein